LSEVGWALEFQHLLSLFACPDSVKPSAAMS
jgi:hypothetical protein